MIRARPGYEPKPRYPPATGEVTRGWWGAVAGLERGTRVLAVDGPVILDWAALVAALTEAFAAQGTTMVPLSMGDHLAAWDEVVARTTTETLADDPDFATLAELNLRELFDRLPAPERRTDALVLAFGPGAALLEHDVLWYADLPKRYAEAAVIAGSGRNLGQPATAGPGTTRRLFYIDWPILDRHRDAIAGRIDRWIDARHPADPTTLDGGDLRATLALLARRPFRTRPTFGPTSWGGHWGQRRLGLGTEAPNSGIGYELIAPESGVVIGDGPEAEVEVPFALIVALHPDEVLGEAVRADFGGSFPIRFDYLDTVDGGNLSVHCHPQPEYMRRVFGWRYTQHESYYVMVGGAGARVFLGLRDEVDLADFERAAQAAVDDGRPFDIERYVQTFPAEPHRLFMIPAGTPHGSGEHNVVLEVSATPYLYSLRFYDWLRQNAAGRQRPVHVGHAFANLNRRRRGAAVHDELVQAPRTLHTGTGWRVELLGALPEVFFEVRRVVLDGDAVVDDGGRDRFTVLNVVEGDGVDLETASGDRHRLQYAETLVVPAAAGTYTLRRLGGERVRVVTARVVEWPDTGR